MSNQEAWSQLTEADLAPWRAETVSRLLLRQLEADREQAKEDLCHLVAMGKIDDAKYMSGLMAGISHAWRLAYPPERIAPEEDAADLDPATRWSKKRRTANVSR